MAKADLKTKVNTESVEDFIHGITDENRKRDAFTMLHLMRELTGMPAKMWGPGIVGFGKYEYKYDSGREGEMLKTGFSPRKNALTLYLLSDFEGRDTLLQQLGKHTTGKSCIYIKNLEEVNQEVWKELITKAHLAMDEKYPEH